MGFYKGKYLCGCLLGSVAKKAYAENKQQYIFKDILNKRHQKIILKLIKMSIYFTKARQQ